MLQSLWWLTIGAFAIGTEGLMIAGLLPSLARELSVPIPLAGHLVTAFSVSYAIASPVLAVATASWRRRRVLQLSMGLFALANLGAAVAPGFAWLVLARVALAACAGLFMATAGGYAAASVAPERRGRAMSIVYMGLAVATVVGVPLGTVAGHLLGWRSTFAGVSALAVVAWAGLCRPSPEPPATSAASLGDRIMVARRPGVAMSLLATVASMTGIFSVYTYLSPMLHQTLGWGDARVAGVLMLFGCGSAAGNLMGGRLADRRGPRPVMSAALGGLSILFAVMSWACVSLTAPWSAVVILAAIACWGLLGWAFPPAQQLNLVQRAAQVPSVVLSLNASATYVGIGLGAALGSWVAAHGALRWIGCGAASLEALALILSRGANGGSRSAASSQGCESYHSVRTPGSRVR